MVNNGSDAVKTDARFGRQESMAAPFTPTRKADDRDLANGVLEVTKPLRAEGPRFGLRQEIPGSKGRHQLQTGEKRSAVT